MTAEAARNLAARERQPKDHDLIADRDARKRGGGARLLELGVRGVDGVGDVARVGDGQRGAGDGGHFASDDRLAVARDDRRRHRSRAA